MLQLVRNMRCEAGVTVVLRSDFEKKTCLEGFQGKIACNFVLAKASIGSSHIFGVFMDLLIDFDDPS